MAAPAPSAIESDHRWPGLTSAEAAARLAAGGRNELPREQGRTFLRILVEVARQPMFLLLLASTAIYVTFGDLREAATLGGFVFFIIGITVVQERRTERALDALRDLSSPHATVRRDGAWTSLDARLLVAGDVILVAEGDRVPADALMRAGAPVTIDESLLTGESVPLIKQPAPDLPGEPASLGPPGGDGGGAALFAGTLVVSGHALAEIVATGPASELGRIGAELRDIQPSRTPLEREVARLVTQLAILGVATSIALVVIRGLIEGGWLRAALSGITLAMSLLPEELPVILTVFLALGAWRIARHRVLTRRTPAVETLGAVTVLCTDKTGTLTQNRMAIHRLVTADADLEVDGAPDLPEEVHALVEFGLLACPPQRTDPMDLAFAALGERTLDGTEHLHPRWQPVREYALRPGLLAVTHVWRGADGQTVVATKGAPEAMIDLCHLADAEAAPWLARAEAMARSGLRVLGVARATGAGIEPPPDAHDYTFEMVGLVGLADPLRDDAADAVALCRRAGIRVLMITGDHPDTARAIARAAGIPADDVVTGAELEALDDDALADRLAAAHVVARAVPAHKLRIVRALRARGEVVGMTGDGVNDAPALKAADIGVAMGKRGTDVAREAASLVLVDDDFGAIAQAVRTGRRIHDNIQKSVGYTLAVHVPIAGMALLPPLLGWGALLAPVHVVFFELVIDPACSIVFEMEPEEPGVMDRPPRRPDAPMLSRRRGVFALLQGALAFGAALAAAAWARRAGLPEEAVRAVAFVAIVAGNLAILVANRSGRGPFWRAFGRGNRGAAWLGGIASTLVALILAVPAARSLFAFTLPGGAWLAGAIAAGAVPVLAADLIKAARG